MTLADALRDRFVLERELGHGGMATVYLARDLTHDRVVALKALNPDLAATLGPERFLREVAVAGRLQHRHVLPLFESGSADGQLWYTMPYVQGESLRDRLRRETQLSIEDSLRIAREVALALDFAHRHGIVHRDIKPDNILLSGYPPRAGAEANGWHAVVADFGIAKALDAAGGEKLTGTGLSLGTPAYMSPEQATASRVDARTDVYSLACVLYEMLAGDPPFSGSTARAIMARHAVDPVPAIRSARPTVPSHVERAIIRALAKVPADRFASAAEFMAALDDSCATVAAPVARGASGRRWLPIGSAFLALAFAAAAAVRFWPRATPASDTSVVAVVPFRVASPDSSLRYLHEGMVDLVAAKLNGDAGPRALEPRVVMQLWNAHAEGRPDLPEGEALRLAGRLKAGRLLTGTVVGASGRLVLSATVVDVATGRVQQQATVDGLHDSLPYLVDRLVGQLLALGAGVQSQRLTSLTSASLPALRAYLTGSSAARAGRWADALGHFRQALKADTTFALAGLGLSSASRWMNGAEFERGQRLAWTARERLSWRDRTLLEALMKSDLASLEAVVSKISDSPEAWFELGDRYYHDGALYGVKDSDGRALAAFRRALALDTATATHPNAEPLIHLADLALAAGDSATVRHLLPLALAQDSTGEFAASQRLALARARADTVAINRWKAGLDTANIQTLVGAIWGSQERGERVPDARLTLDILRRRSGSKGDLPRSRGVLRMLAHDFALNAGRPAEAARQRLGSYHPRDSIRGLIDDALYWGGDTTIAAAAARETGTVVAGPAPPADSLLHAYYYDVCTLEQWRLAQGNTRTAPVSIARLRAAATLPGIRYPEEHERCADLLDAWYATATRQPDARARLARVDSLQAHSPVGITSSPITASNLLVTRLWEEQGDWARAEAAARRRYKGLNPKFLSTHLREEGRAAALAGRGGAAIRAYQHYLALRYDPEPSVMPEVQQVRAELAALMGER